jgi:hypothetical protein
MHIIYQQNHADIHESSRKNISSARYTKKASIILCKPRKKIVSLTMSSLKRVSTQINRCKQSVLLERLN